MSEIIVQRDSEADPDSAAAPPDGAAAGAAAPDPRRWKALGALALVQFVIFLDATIVNVALPSIRRDLGFSEGGLAWVVNGYLLAAGGLLLLGGRLSDLLGRRRMFSLGAALFAVASLTAALAQNPAMLIASRFAQGTGEALAAPAAMSMVALLFTDEKERAKAFGIWGGLAGLGAAAGVLLSGVLTDLLSWHWVFFIGIPPCVASVLLVFRLVPESRVPESRRRSLGSALLLTAGLVAVIDGLLGATDHAWTSAAVLGPVAAGVVALAVFLAVQARSAAPLIPLGFFTSRTRATGYAAQLFMATATAAMFFLIVLYMQDTLHYSPLRSGLSWLPFTVAFMPGLVFSTKTMPKLGYRGELAIGLAVIAAGMFLFSRLGPDSSFLTGLLPAMALAAFGSGVVAPAMQVVALHGVSDADAGLGSGVLTTVQQVSQALGLSAIVAIGFSHQRSLLKAGISAASANTQGRQLALEIATVVLLVGSVACLALLRKPAPAAESAEPSTI
ncbi:MFS transporter [Kitasatospora acidiphila]|uniref:MFS transporter n=1 Tax=Kitasatospora acidiphila TaxID=2567942 RepID=A0A540W0N1_9ACTN|nr:MFS transporter [Kitasatospora acidiphila]TQF01914.1 MFS transporter [Kitasatospora acidiphila]